MYVRVHLIWDVIEMSFTIKAGETSSQTGSDRRDTEIQSSGTVLFESIYSELENGDDLFQPTFFFFSHSKST